MQTSHLASRLRQLAACLDPTTRVRPPFPFGAHEWLRQAAARLEQPEAPPLRTLSKDIIDTIAARYAVDGAIINHEAYARALERAMHGIKQP